MKKERIKLIIGWICIVLGFVLLSISCTDRFAIDEQLRIEQCTNWNRAVDSLIQIELKRYEGYKLSPSEIKNIELKVSNLELLICKL